MHVLSEDLQASSIIVGIQWHRRIEPIHTHKEGMHNQAPERAHNYDDMLVLTIWTSSSSAASDGEDLAWPAKLGRCCCCCCLVEVQFTSIVSDRTCDLTAFSLSVWCRCMYLTQQWSLLERQTAVLCEAVIMMMMKRQVLHGMWNWLDGLLEQLGRPSK